MPRVYCWEGHLVETGWQWDGIGWCATCHCGEKIRVVPGRRIFMKRGNVLAMVCVALAIVLSCALVAVNAGAQTRSSVVSIETPSGGRGSGFYVTRHLILTNAHVVDDRVDNTVVVMRNYVRYWGEVVKEDQELDLALVKVKSRGPRPFRFCDKLKRHEQLKIWTYDYGRFRRKKTNIYRMHTSRVTITGNVIPGNSGTPAVREKGFGRCVAGVVRAYQMLTGRGVLISAIYAKKFVNDFLESE